MLTILYFAWVRERVGVSQEKVAPPTLGTVAELADWLMTQSADHRAALGDRERLRVAVDQQFAGWDASVEGAREVAFFPPVTGG